MRLRGDRLRVSERNAELDLGALARGGVETQIAAPIGSAVAKIEKTILDETLNFVKHLTSEDQLHCQLPDAGIAGAADRAEPSSAHRADRIVPVHPVEGIKELRPKLKAPTLVNRETLEHS